MSDQTGSASGLTSREAQEFHKYFMTYTLVYIAVAIVAHFLVWQWRSWLPGEGGYAAITETVPAYAQSFLTLLS